MTSLTPSWVKVYNFKKRKNGKINSFCGFPYKKDDILF